jgi:ABC-type branched-subunit amino acid transport system ATPase component
MTAALETQGLTRSFGAIRVAQAIDFRLDRGARHALIGPNGAGKTTFVNLVTGRLAPSAGRILVGGGEVTRLAEAKRVKLGLVRTFQINQLFRGLSVLENVALSVAERRGTGSAIFASAASRRAVLDEAYALLERLRLEGAALTRVGELPYGRQRLVEIAIALGLEPKVLLLDEPAAGVPSAETGILLDAIASLPEAIAILIIEHDMELVFRFAAAVTVLVQGAVLLTGTPREIAADPRVREVYLGEERALWPAA